jgi:hypothetical protein
MSDNTKLALAYTAQAILIGVLVGCVVYSLI